ncbi:MAG: HAD hydrolase-like protein, partial [Cyanobacteria bacterium J06627_15]
AGKPSRRKLRQALAAIDLPAETVAMVGDRLFTDVLAGNRLGLFTVLVDPVIELRSMNPKKLLRGLEIWISARLGVTLKALT